MVSVTEVSKSFGSVKALSNVTFSVGESEIVGLLGPNGAGKTTMMRVMVGFFSPDKGDVTIGNYSVLKSPVDVKKLIGYLPEDNPLYKDMLVGDLLNYSSDLRGLVGDEKKKALDFAVSSTNISDVYFRPISELSKGYRQRVGLSIALLHKPKVLILDEPSEGLDPNQRGETRKLIRQLAKKHTVIISTHVMQEVEALCSRVVVINKGKIVADDSVSKLIRNLKKDRVVTIDIEGKSIKTFLKDLKLEDIEIEMKKRNRFEVRIKVDSKTLIQPMISNLAHKNKWIIWSLTEDKPQLEDVFKELTE